jgi:trans-aconitate 2-methyltransferase
MLGLTVRSPHIFRSQKGMQLNHLWDSSQYARTSDLQASVAGDLIRDLAVKSDENVLDLGCGLGNLTMDIAEIAEGGLVLGIDTSPSMIEEARKNLLLRRLSNVSFRQTSVTGLQLDDQFDVVFSNSVLHWIKDQEDTLRAIHRCLKAGGRIGLQFPLLDTSHPLVALTREAIHLLQLGRRYDSWQFPWFVPESMDAYADLARNASFKEVSVRRCETCYAFESASTAYGFFSSVGFDLFLQPLSPEEGVSLKEKVLSLLTARAAESGVRLDFCRQYVLATS